MPSTQCGWNDIPGGSSGADLLINQGPLLFVDIGFDPNFNIASPGVPVPGRTNLPALVDTGAGESCIDSLLAAQLNLPLVDRRTVAGVHGASAVNMHLAQVHVPALGFTIYGQFAGVDLRLGGQSIDALIGRTFLCRLRMSYDGLTGQVELTSP